MPELRHAYVQHSYRPIVIIFSLIVVALLAVTLIATGASATVTVTPKLLPIDTSFALTIGPQENLPDGLLGQVALSTASASVTAQPSNEGTAVPAHAHGEVVIHNDGGARQSLVAGTRLQSTDGIIVRTANSVDVPAHGTVTVNVTADPEGESGNLQPGRLTIVALRPANQAIVYGQIVTALTGGTVTQGGTLAISALTTATDQAKKKIEQQIGPNTAGHLRLLVPDAVTTKPSATTPSDAYTVTVVMKVFDVTYDAGSLSQKVRDELSTQLASDQRLAIVNEPTIAAGEQPTKESLTVTITAQAEAVLDATSTTLQAKNFVGLTADEIAKKLQGNSAIKSVTTTFFPWWRRSAPDQANRIRVTLISPATQP